MKLIPAAHELISNMRGLFRTKTTKIRYLNEEPLRASLFSSDQMEHFGKTLAKTHKLSLKPAKDHLLKRLANNEKILHEVRKLLANTIKQKEQITPAGEWLVDNFYLIEEHIRNAKTHFPKDYSEDLPQLLDGDSGGQTRIYDIVLQIIAHSDGRIDLEGLSRFITAYQTVSKLKLGELWAIPIMLRLALIENLRRISARIAIDRIDRNLANYWSKLMIETAGQDPKNLILVIADMARSSPPLVSAFVSELNRQLRGKGPSLALSLNWVEQQLSENGLTSIELVNAENQKLSADQLSMSHGIGSLRMLGAMDWRDFVETHSIVEQILREDIGNIYQAMDFSTRDRYRHVVEHIAKESRKPEQEVARLVIDLSLASKANTVAGECPSHVGYFLIGPGLRQTKKAAKMREPLISRVRTPLKKQVLTIYLSAILLITLGITSGLLFKASLETKNGWLLFCIGLLSLLCCSQLAISLVNFFSTLLVKPHLLPRMDFSQQIPLGSRTLVVVPSMLITTDEIETLVEALEVRYLANRNNNLHFALLTDFTDAAEEKLAGDKVLTDLVLLRIKELNIKYRRDKNDLFLLFHRFRCWNPQESVWMGYERKRGKLSQLNAVLRGASEECFSIILGDRSIFSSIKFIITLDADTQLPMGSAWKLVGTMAHPLNRAWYDKKLKRVTKGYGILQPRVTVSLPDISGSMYARMHGNEPGIDPYTRTSSDVYQDLFAEGSFIGKGIYDLDVFQEVLEGRFALNSILSHDLLEGCYVRSGLLSDVQLFEKYPTRYSSDMKRRIRWIRGDWQLFSWFLPFVPGEGRQWQKNPISTLSRWKIFDNIRRSLLPIALTLFLMLGWIAFSNTLFWTLAVSVIIVFPIFITSVWDTIRKPKDVIFSHHIRNSFSNIRDICIKTLFALICLPYEAFSNSIAISRTLWRMLISRKKLLEWNPSANDKSGDSSCLQESYTSMWIDPLLTSSLFIFILVYSPSKLFVVLPILLCWLIAPGVTWWASKPLEKQGSVLTDLQNLFLRKLARKTWSFFERFVTLSDNWLPPDNFQEQPVITLAHRTSPTNMGLSLLANLSACDFGYISTHQLIERTSQTLDSMAKMERYKGHFFNWYDTESLNPLSPKYISTVDSGNLASHLLVLRQGLLATCQKPAASLKLFDGIRETFLVLVDTLEEMNRSLVESFRQELESVCTPSDISIREAGATIGKLIQSFDSVFGKFPAETNSETDWWKAKLLAQLNGAKEAIQIYNPWVLLASAPDNFIWIDSLDANSTLIELLNNARELLTKTKKIDSANISAKEARWYESIQISLAQSICSAEENISAMAVLAVQCEELSDMEWDFLFDNSSKLLTIGYNVLEHKMDASFYDLLASEARLCTFLGIAQGKLSEESWFALGRLLTNVDGEPILLSWSGSMFEYLMPLLVMPTYENTLLDQTYRSVVEWQINYGKRSGMPWGISESGYNSTNANSDYQYRAFGAPGLGLKRGLEEDSVIAPYASALALMVDPENACKNLEQLAANGVEGSCGLYEAVDYTPSRLPRGQSHAVVYSYMAHHQGMSLLSLAYLILDKPMQKYFEAEPQFKAALLLLQERIPRATTFFAHTTDISDINYTTGGSETRIINTPNTSVPEVQLLSNGRYHVMITNSGAGYSRWKDLAVTRWHEDVTCDNWGTFCYIRDVENNNYWSNAFQPTLQKNDLYEASFSQGHVHFRTSRNGIDTHTEIVVSPEDDIEIRRLTLTNISGRTRTIELTSYAEVVMAHPASDLMQPAFSNLFVQTEIIPHQHAIRCTRRPRSKEEQTPWMFHLMTMEGKDPEQISYETNRMEFIGRGHTRVDPQVMSQPGPLAGNQGSVLDPIVAIRYKITLLTDEKVTIDLITGIAESETICQNLIDKYQDKHHKERVFDLAWTHSQVVLRQINASEADAQLYCQLAGAILFTNPAYRADASILINNHRGQSGLWGYSISGDLPIVLLKIENQDNRHLVMQLIQAHAYWRLKGLAVDLVIWNEEQNGYRQVFQDEIYALIPDELRDRSGGVFVRASDQISMEDRILFQTVARINISDNGESLGEQMKRKVPAKQVIPYLKASQTFKPDSSAVALPSDLQFFNGTGGFSADGSEYVIAVDQNKRTPAPWVNVIANPDFGTVISESGAAYTWTENAHELRLTPWANDAVSDSGGEAFYLRDEENGHYWSTTLLPAGAQSPYLTRHGFGYSVFEHIENGIYSEMTVYVDLESSIKFTSIKIRNESGRLRKLSATGYIEWVMGDDRAKTAMHIHTEIDSEIGALFATNPYSTEFSSRVAFFDVDDLNKTFTADRTEFIGRNGTLKNPEALTRQRLSGKIGLAMDPCAAIQVPFDLQDGEEFEIVFRLGAGKDLRSASATAKQFRGATAARESLEKVKNYWKYTLAAVKVETPDASINILTNGWLNYQTISSRLWGRSGFYQSGGAFGYRDQLQDVMSLLHSVPKLAREQILLCSSRQFCEGDVQHWWHPPIGRGVRTRCSDDFLWLPFVAALYTLHTGDHGIFDESRPFLEGRLLNAGEESYYDLPVISVKSATLYEHCVLAIKHGFRYGIHGLPLIGTGDWNDGFDKVGNEGKGESVWMAFFLYEILVRFGEISRSREDEAFAELCKTEATKLKENINKHAWDGQWYKRAWFDNGSELGSSKNEECRIDSIAQSWSVLSGGGDVKNSKTAIESAYKCLVKKETGIIQLLDPAFDKSDLNPGYIKGYVPGVRENGGQYTHGAVWLITAFAKMGDKKTVWELLNLINPINHGKTSETMATYKVEPYVLAADVYACNPHEGRGGWTWYTGAAGWMYRLVIESFLGLQREADKLKFMPCIPEEWESFKICYRYKETTYHIAMTQKSGPGNLIVTLDNVVQEDKRISLINDAIEHAVQVLLFSESAETLK